MSGPSAFEDVGARLHTVAAVAALASYNSGTSTAAGVYTTTGYTLDRMSSTGNSNFPRRSYESVKLVVPYTLTLGTGTARTFTLRAQIKSRQNTSGTGSTWDTLATATKTTSKTTATVAAAEDRGTPVLNLDADLRPAARYLKVNLQRLFSSTVTGTTVSVGPAVLVLGGANLNRADGA